MQVAAPLTSCEGQVTALIERSETADLPFRPATKACYCWIFAATICVFFTQQLPENWPKPL